MPRQDGAQGRRFAHAQIGQRRDPGLRRGNVVGPSGVPRECAHRRSVGDNPANRRRRDRDDHVRCSRDRQARSGAGHHPADVVTAPAVTESAAIPHPRRQRIGDRDRRSHAGTGVADAQRVG